MRSRILAAMLFLGAALPSSADEIKQALAVDAPPPWSFKYKGDKGVQFYTLIYKGSDRALLMFSKSPVPGNAANIPEQLDTLAKGFVSRAKDSKDFKLATTEYKLEKLDGATFTGSYVEFSAEGGILQTMFMLGDAEGIWSGQFTGTKERWAAAIEILKKLKKNG